MADDGGWAAAWADDPDADFTAAHGRAAIVRPLAGGAWVSYRLAESGRLYYVDTATLAHTFDAPPAVVEEEREAAARAERPSGPAIRVASHAAAARDRERATRERCYCASCTHGALRSRALRPAG